MAKAKKKPARKKRPISKTRRAKLARQGRTLKGRYKRGSSAAKRNGSKGGSRTAEITRPCRKGLVGGTWPTLKL